MIEPIYFSSPLEYVSERQHPNYQLPSASISSEESQSARAGRRRLKLAGQYVMQSNLDEIQTPPPYLNLEIKADTSMAKARKEGWGNGMTLFEKEFYFRTAFEQYEEGYNLANDMGMFQDAIRLLEKAAYVLDKKLGNTSAAIHKLLRAFEMRADLGDHEKSSVIGESVRILADAEIERRYADKERNGNGYFWNHRIATMLRLKAVAFEKIDSSNADEMHRETRQFCERNDLSYSNLFETPQEIPQVEESEPTDFNKIFDLINEAAVIENLDPQQAAIVYEEAGKLCLEENENGVAVLGKFHGGLVAGLCFEKSSRTASQVFSAYCSVLDDLRDYERKKILSPKKESGIENLMEFIEVEPFYLQAALASLKCGRKDIFTGLVESRVDLLSDVFSELYKKLDLEADSLSRLLSYLHALTNSAGHVIGFQHPDYLKMKEMVAKADIYKGEFINVKLPDISVYQAQTEADLLQIFTNWEGVTVQEMIRRFEHNTLPFHF